MAFINQAVTVLQTLVIALGAGLAVWGVINLMEGYGNDNPAANAHVREGNTHEFDRQPPTISRSAGHHHLSCVLYLPLNRLTNKCI